MASDYYATGFAPGFSGAEDAAGLAANSGAHGVTRPTYPAPPLPGAAFRRISSQTQPRQRLSALIVSPHQSRLAELGYVHYLFGVSRMTASELQRIEQQLGVRLPADYKAAMQSYPFTSDSYAAEFMLPDNAGVLLDLAGGRDVLPPHSFIIGTDGGEETYFIDTTRSPSPVFVFQVETGKISEESSSLSAYLQKCRVVHGEIRLDQEQMAKKNWWEFWK